MSSEHQIAFHLVCAARKIVTPRRWSQLSFHVAGICLALDEGLPTERHPATVY